MILKLGSKGPKVIEVQKKLGLTPDGDFGKRTEAAVILFQQHKQLTPDGVVGNKTAELMGLVLEPLDTDNTHYHVPVSTDFVIHKSYLDKDEYYPAKTEKTWLILHFTAGNHNPYACIKDWNSDTRGRIATQFVIGGKSLGGDTTHDGVVVECMPDSAWAYHLGNNGNSKLHPNSVGIEICCWGQLTKKDNGKYYTYTGDPVPEDQVCDLGFKHRGFQYYHAYTDAQLDSLYKLIMEIKKRHPKIDLNAGMKDWLINGSVEDAFEFNNDAFYAKYSGIFTHTNIRKDKSDLYPDPRVIELIKSL